MHAFIYAFSITCTRLFAHMRHTSMIQSRHRGHVFQTIEYERDRCRHLPLDGAQGRRLLVRMRALREKQLNSVRLLAVQVRVGCALARAKLQNSPLRSCHARGVGFEKQMAEQTPVPMSEKSPVRRWLMSTTEKQPVRTWLTSTSGYRHGCTRADKRRGGNLSRNSGREEAVSCN